MTNGRRALARRTVLAAGAGLAAACAARPAPASPSDLVWVTGGIRDADLRPAQMIADRWNRSHPRGPRVLVQSLPESASLQRQMLYLELKAGLTNFDIFDLDQAYTAEFARNGWLAELEQLRPQITPLSLAPVLRSAEWDGTLWAAPYVGDAGLLYYRSDLLSASSEPPRTWKEVLAEGRRIGEQRPDLAVAPFVADGAQYEGMVVQYLEYFWSMGGQIFADDQGGSVLFPVRTAERAARFMFDCFDQRYYAPGFETMKLEDARRAFQAGRAVFMRSWPYAYQSMNAGPDSRIRGNVGVAPLPGFDGEPPVTALGGHNLAVSAFSRDIPAATEFVRFVSTDRDVQLSLGRDHSLVPSLRSVYEHPDLMRNPMLTVVAEVLPTARQRPATPEWATISAEFQQQVYSAYTGARSPGQAAQALRTFLIETAQGS